MKKKIDNLAYDYAKQAIELIYQNHEANKKIKHKLYLEALSKKIKQLTQEYLFQSMQTKVLDKLKKLNKPISILESCFQTITQALLNAKTNEKFIIDVQFNLIDLFLYATWALIRPHIALKIFKQIESNFQFPNVDLKKQYEICCELAQKIYEKQQNTQCLQETLQEIYQRFLKHANEINQWKEVATQKCSSKIIKQLEIKLYEWNLIKYIMTLYIIVYGYRNQDEVFKKLIYGLLNNADKTHLAIQAINYLLATKNIINNLQHEPLKEMYQNIYHQCSNLMQTNEYFVTKIYS